MKGAGFVLRAIDGEDAADVAALIRDVFAAIDPPLVPPPSALRETAETVSAQIAAGGGMVAVAGREIVGAVLWGPRDGGLYVGRLSVSAGWRRRGMAQALMGAAEDHARRMGYPHMHIGVRLALAGNRRLFAGLGFVETTLHTHDGFAEPTWVALEKRLG